MKKEEEDSIFRVVEYHSVVSKIHKWHFIVYQDMFMIRAPLILTCAVISFDGSPKKQLSMYDWPCF